jgi:hypothetical protein
MGTYKEIKFSFALLVDIHHFFQKSLIANSFDSLFLVGQYIMRSISALFATALIQTVLCSPTRARRQESFSTATGVDLQLPTNAFGSAVEGTSVNKYGDMFAADFRADGASASSSYAFFFQSGGKTANIVSNQNPFFTAANDTPVPPLLAGSRFLRDGRVLLTGMFTSIVCFRFCTS